jgi:UDP-galactopyranose mutase
MGTINVHKYGAHIFHTSEKKVWDFANLFDEMMPFVNSPVAMVTREGHANPEVFNLPFNMNTFTKLWPDVLSVADAKKRIEESAKKFDKLVYTNLEERALSMVGEEIYELFIKGYTEKQWGKSCKELDANIITRIPLRFRFDNNYFNDVYQGIPKNGYTQWISNMFDGVAQVITGEDYLKCKDEWNARANLVFYSGRLDEYFDYSLGDLPYRSLKFVTEEKDTDNYQGVAVVNYTQRHPDYTRTIEHKHFEPWNRLAMMESKSIVSFEYPQEMTRDTEAYYPVKSKESTELYRKYCEMLPFKVVPTGRLGMYRYNDMDDTISQALQLADCYLK